VTVELFRGRYQRAKDAENAAEYKLRMQADPDYWTACILTRSWDVEPVVHLLDLYAEQGYVSRHPDQCPSDTTGPWTLCGVNRFAFSSPELPLRHAQKVGRPCRRCFPDGWPT